MYIPRPANLLFQHDEGEERFLEKFDARSAEMRAFFNNQLDPVRSSEFRDRLLAIGLPI